MTDYATLAELKVQLNITSSSHDTELQARLDAAHDRINEDCGRTFDVNDGTASQREYPITSDLTLVVDDFASSTGLAVALFSASATTVDSANYRTKPDNALAKGYAAWILETRGYYRWPLNRTTAYVTAKWGWLAVPKAIHDACLLLAARLYRRKDTPQGVQGSAELGLIRITSNDPDYWGLIGGYVRPQV